MKVLNVPSVTRHLDKTYVSEDALWPICAAGRVITDSRCHSAAGSTARLAKRPYDITVMYQRSEN